MASAGIEREPERLELVNGLQVCCHRHLCAIRNRDAFNIFVVTKSFS